MNKIKIFSLLYNQNIALLLLAALLFSGCSSPHKKSSSSPLLDKGMQCKNASRYAGRVVGDGHCVALIKACSGAPSTQFWRPGADVYSQPKTAITPGTIIATFLNGKYPNKTGWHAAIYISHNAYGIWVWDQWLGKPVHKRLIRYRHDKATPGNTAQRYQIVNLK